MRDFRALLKSPLNYDRVDGLDLMLEREASDDLNLEEEVPELDFTVSDTLVSVGWKKSGFHALDCSIERRARPFGSKPISQPKKLSNSSRQ